MLDTYKFIENYKRISIIGMEKNVGKTTLLNKLIADIGKTKKLGLTSIGRDGEDIDVVTNTDKPRIYVREGSIIATGRDCLSKCDITKEILYVTNFTTPMGSIVLVRALSDGYVDIAGPSYNKQVKIVVELMEKFGSEISIVDGALGRKSTAISDVSEATILSTGAALSLDMTKVVDETKKTEQVIKKIDVTEGILKDFNDYEIKGYEIHQGITNISSPIICKDNVFATYIHGIFDNSKFTNDLLNMIRRKKSMSEQKEALSFNEFKEREYDKLAKLLRENLDIEEIYKILG